MAQVRRGGDHTGSPKGREGGSNDRVEHTHATRGACVRRVRVRPVSPTRARTGVPAQGAGLRAGRTARRCRGAERAWGCCPVLRAAAAQLGGTAAQDLSVNKIYITNMPA